MEEAAVAVPLRPGVRGCRGRSRRAILLQVWRHRDVLVLILVDAQEVAEGRRGRGRYRLATTDIGTESGGRRRRDRRPHRLRRVPEVQLSPPGLDLPIECPLGHVPRDVWRARVVGVDQVESALLERHLLKVSLVGK